MDANFDLNYPLKNSSLPSYFSIRSWFVDCNKNLSSNHQNSCIDAIWKRVIIISFEVVTSIIYSFKLCLDSVIPLLQVHLLIVAKIMLFKFSLWEANLLMVTKKYLQTIKKVCHFKGCFPTKIMTKYDFRSIFKTTLTRGGKQVLIWGMKYWNYQGEWWELLLINSKHLIRLHKC